MIAGRSLISSGSTLISSGRWWARGRAWWGSTFVRLNPHVSVWAEPDSLLDKLGSLTELLLNVRTPT